MNTVLRSLYEIHRHQIILHARENDGKWRFPTAYLFALSRGLFPAFHRNWSANEIDPFMEVYLPRHEFVTEVLAYADKAWTDSVELGFHDLVLRYPGNLVNLIHIFRYVRLSHAFDDKFFKRLLTHPCPGDSRGIMDDFRLDDLELT